MELSELSPKEIKFKVSDVELTFRPFTIADDLRANDLCGGQKELAQAFSVQDLEKLSLLGWHQLTLESQRRVLQVVEGVYIDPETGKEVNANLTPIAKFQNLFWSPRDKAELIVNLLNCRGLNIPSLDDEEGLKKWISQVVPLVKELTGEQSLTSLRPNTDTTGNNSLN